MNEIWKDINGHEGRYQISNKGRVKRLASSAGKRTFKEEIKKPTYLINGLNPYVTLNTSKIKVSRLVAEAFVNNPNGYRFIKHKNGNTIDLCAENLEWTNNKSSICRSGVNNGIIKVDTISGEIINTYESIKQASADSGVSESQIKASCRGVSHKTGDYMYFFDEDRPMIAERIQQYKDKHERVVFQLNKSGTIIDIFNSITLASLKTGISYHNIWNCCTGKVKSSKGYRFSFSEEQRDCIKPDEV